MPGGSPGWRTSCAASRWGADPALVRAAIGDGLAAADGERAGDLLLFAAELGQLHLGVRTAAGFVHADAGLGRVIERPGMGELRRGRFATEGASPAAPGARFALLEADAVLTIELPPQAIGRELRVLASGVGDGDGPVEARLVVDGRSVLPLAPVHLRATPLGDGGAVVTWVRRSRAGWNWIDGADSPLGEERESWSAEVTRADGGTRTVSLEGPALRIDAVERAAGPVTVVVRQAGDRGLGPPARMVVPGSIG